MVQRSCCVFSISAHHLRTFRAHTVHPRVRCLDLLAAALDCIPGLPCPLRRLGPSTCGRPAT